MDDVRQVTRFPRGVIHMPPSKSVAHRAVICAALSGDGGVERVTNVAWSDDLSATLRCVRGMTDGATVQHSMVLDCGESGSTLRFLIPIAAALGINVTFTGRGRLMERPLGPYFDMLPPNGVSLKLGDGGLSVSGNLRAGRFEVEGNVSSQFITGLILALPLVDGDSEVVVTTPLESASYVGLTLDVMEKFGVSIENDNFAVFRIKGGQRYVPCDYAVEGDWSQAAFFLAAGALGCECSLTGLSAASKQGDRVIVDILRKSGVDIYEDDGQFFAKQSGHFTPQTVDVSDIPDLVPPLAAFLCFCDGESRIVNAARLRLKESDRLAAVSEELNVLGADITVVGDDMVIRGVKRLRGGTLNARGDHRIAMMGAVAAVRSDAPVYVSGASCVAKSYPEFWHDFEKEVKR